MKIDYQQKINLLAIEIIETFGNVMPTQQQIDYVEAFLMGNKKRMLSAQNMHMQTVKHSQAVNMASVSV